MTPQQVAALKAVTDAIIEAVAAAGPTGAPAGPLYAFLMRHGCSLSQFQSIMRGLVAAGKLTANDSATLYCAPQPQMEFAL